MQGCATLGVDGVDNLQEIDTGFLAVQDLESFQDELKDSRMATARSNVQRGRSEIIGGEQKLGCSMQAEIMPPTAVQMRWH